MKKLLVFLVAAGVFAQTRVNPGQIGPLVASASSIVVPAATGQYAGSPWFGITGTATVNTLTGAFTGQQGTLTTLNGPVTFTGGNIGSPCTTASGNTYSWVFDGALYWIVGPGCTTFTFNLGVPGTINVGVGTGVAGALDLYQGTQPALMPGAVTWMAPQAVTSYGLQLPPGAPGANDLLMFGAPVNGISQGYFTALTNIPGSSGFVQGAGNLTTTNCIPYQNGTLGTLTCSNDLQASIGANVQIRLFNSGNATTNVQYQNSADTWQAGINSLGVQGWGIGHVSVCNCLIADFGTESNNHIGFGPFNSTSAYTEDVTDLTASTGTTRFHVGLGAADTALTNIALIDGSLQMGNGSLTTLLNNGIATTATDSMLLKNATASTALVTQQFSPALHLTGHAWNTTTPADNQEDWRIYSAPTSGTTPGTGFNFDYQLAGGGYNTMMQLYYAQGATQNLLLSLSSPVAHTSAIQLSNSLDTWQFGVQAFGSAGFAIAHTGGCDCVLADFGGTTSNQIGFGAFNNSGIPTSTTVDITDKTVTTGATRVTMGLGAADTTASTTLAVGGTATFGGSVEIGLGGKYQCAHGSNATCGVSTLSSGTVTVSTTAIGALAASGGAGFVVKLVLETCSSCGSLSVGTVTGGTSFVINSTNGSDASHVYWEIGYIN